MRILGGTVVDAGLESLMSEGGDRARSRKQHFCSFAAFPDVIGWKSRG